MLYELAVPVDASGKYAVSAGSVRAEQVDVDLCRVEGARWYESDISGAQRLPNGNTMITYGTHGVLVEVTQSGDLVWQNVNPATNTGSMYQGAMSGLNDGGTTDQVNLGPLPPSLAGKGEVKIMLTIDGKTANVVTVNLK